MSRRALAGLPRLAAALTALAASGPTTAALLAQETARPLEIADLFRIQAVGDPRISPDGDVVAYTVATTDTAKDRRTTRVWMISMAGGDALPLTAEVGSASAPRWSPDGRTLTFLTTRGDSAKSQVWALDRRGGDARALTDVKNGVRTYEWSPDGRLLALLIADAVPDSADDGEDEPRDPWVVDRLQFKRDGLGYLNRLRTQLYVYDLGQKQLRKLTAGDSDISTPRWSPDGSRIAFVSNRTADPDANTNSDIWVLPVDADTTTPMMRVTANEGPDGNPAWSPDGRWIAYVTSTNDPFAGYSTNDLALVGVEGTEGNAEERAARLLAPDLDRNVSGPAFSDDGRSVVFGLEDARVRHIARVDLGNGRVTRLVEGDRSVRGFDLGPDGTLAFLASTPERPTEVFVHEGRTERKLTAVNDALLSRLRLAEVRPIEFSSPDGTGVQGFLFLPPGHDPLLRYPTLLRIHGGPVGQYDFGFNFEAQLFAANGYAVVISNPRGSSGRGSDYSMALWRKWGVPDYQDVMAAVDYVIAEGVADSTRLGVGGWSYGGILTNYVITRTDRFQGATTGASMALLVANFGHDHYQLANELEWGLPWENREVWEELSPFNAVEKIVTPTLIMGGEKDWNVPIQNSEQLYQALRRRGVPTQLVVYPGQPHGIGVPSYQRDRYERYLAWYDRYVKGSGELRAEGGS